MKKTNRIILFFLALLTIIGFFYRFNGLSINYSFWIDETSSAAFARAILERGRPVLATGYAANDYLLHFWLMAGSFKVFGLNEFAARFPSVFFGALTIPLVYLLGKRYGDFRVGLLAAILTAFSILEITYSRQARSYQEVQFFFLLTILAFLVFLEAWTKQQLRPKHLLFLFVSFALASLTHKFALLFLFEAVIYLILFRFDLLKKNFLSLFSNRPFLTILLFVAFLFLLHYFNFYKAIRETTFDFWAGKFGLTAQQYLNIVLSHLKYYHSFFWRQYPHVSLLALLGLILGVLKKNHLVYLFLVIFAIHFSFIILRVFPQFVRYVYLVFPLFIILTAYFLVWIADNLVAPKNRFLSNLLLIFLVLFLVVNGNKFTLLPKSYYSLNFDMAEVPEPDFKSVYQVIKSKVDLSRENVVVIENRADAGIWYLGEGMVDYYLVGPNELEPEWYLKQNIKKDPVTGAWFLTNLDEFKNILNSNPKGFVVLEVRALEYVNVDSQLIDYIKKNLKQEVRYEHISGNNLSLWPIELYSWGIN